MIPIVKLTNIFQTPIIFNILIYLVSWKHSMQKIFIFFLLVYKANTTRLTTSNTFRMIDKNYDPPLSMLFCSPSICENLSNKLSTSKTSNCHVSLNLMTSVTLSFHAHLRFIKPKTLPKNINLPHNLKHILLRKL